MLLLTVSNELATDGFPLCHGLQSVMANLVGRRFCAIWNEEVSDSREDEDEMLERPDRSETLPHSFPLSKRQVRILGPVVQALMRTMLNRGHDLTHCCSIGAQLVGDGPLGRKALSLQEPGQQTSGRLGVATFLDDFVEHITILIDSPP